MSSGTIVFPTSQMRSQETEKLSNFAHGQTANIRKSQDSNFSILALKSEAFTNKLCHSSGGV
jgi:hypothetical protein